MVVGDGRLPHLQVTDHHSLMKDCNKNQINRNRLLFREHDFFAVEHFGEGYYSTNGVDDVGRDGDD